MGGLKYISGRPAALRVLGAMLAGVALSHAPAWARPDESFVVIKAGKIITGAGEEMENAEVVIVDGKIRLVGRKLEYPKSAKIIDASKETIAPGLIHLRARPDLREYNTRSGVRGDFKTSTEVTPGAVDFEPFLRNGFTSVAIYPTGQQVSGVASVFHTGGPAGERVLDVPGYVRMTMTSQPRDKGTLRDVIRKAKAEIEKVEKAKKDWEEKKKEADAKKKAEGAPGEPPKEGPPAPPTPPKPEPKTESESPTQPIPRPVPPQPQPPAPQPAGPPAPTVPAEFKAPEMDPTHRPFIDLLQKKAGAPMIMMELGKSSDYVHARDVLDDEKEEKDLKRFYYLGSAPGFADFNYIVEKLTEAKAGVVMPPVMHRMPNSVSRYHLAGSLIAGGAEVAFVPTGDSTLELETYRARVADIGRPVIERADLIKAMTINAAKMLGAEKLIGSIEKGKSADIVFLDGDLLSPLAEVTRVMINGEIVWKAPPLPPPLPPPLSESKR